jgi:hypothetical protein
LAKVKLLPLDGIDTAALFMSWCRLKTLPRSQRKREREREREHASYIISVVFFPHNHDFIIIMRKYLANAHCRTVYKIPDTLRECQGQEK